jgi:ABC-type lipoprotein export system ATPase subunit
MNDRAKGSEWRKWDMHIHTPLTKLNDQFTTGQGEDVWKLYCDRIENSDVYAFGITDYFNVDNYFTFIDQFKKHYPQSEKIFFPNIEFRLSVSVNKRAEEVNIHVIFSNRVERKKIDDFLLKLNTNITRNSIAVPCKNLSAKSDFESATVEYSKITETLREVFGNETCYIIVAASNNSGLRADTSSPRKLTLTDEIDKVCHSFFGGSQNTEHFLKIDRYESIEPSKPKPVIGGSDAHSFNDMDNSLGKRVTFKNISSGKEEIVKDVTWIKTELIFEGLLQILNEPSRVYIGETPPIIKRVNTNPTKYIKSLELRKIEGSVLGDVWFDNLKVHFNPELVAIIGNKGKGKSALADILGLSANAHVDESDFSFLHKTKFRNPRPNLAKEFTATLTWEGGAPEVKGLDSLPNLNAPERVKYIPQSFLEKLCTSIDKKVFEEELEKVIFSRLEDHQKLGKGTLKEVLGEKKLSIGNEIARIKNDLSQQNNVIVDLERRNSSQYRKSIDEALLVKKNELLVHDQNQPPQKEPPQQTEETQRKTEQVTVDINTHRNSIKAQLETKASLNSERSNLSLEINELIQLGQSLSALSDYIARNISSNQALLKKYQLDPESLVVYTVNVTSVNELLHIREGRLLEIEEIFKDNNPGNPDAIVIAANTAIKRLQDELEGESREYQQYLTEFQEWEKQRNSIVGTPENEGSLSYYEAAKNYLATNMEEELTASYQLRGVLVRQLLQEKKSIADLYKELYGPVSEFITHNRNELSDYNVNIAVALEVVEFPEKFFNYISNGAAGSFYGSNESRQVLGKISDVVDFNDPEAVVKWLDEIMTHLRQDKREDNGPKREMGTQLKGGFKEKDFYDFLYSLDYYEPNYQLKLGEKNLSELSPGERGALLLIFYLLLDKRDIPIIIDQPEENLDNQSVYRILVHFIKKAKEKRQIIIVTHNPNLAVVCDAEQVIRMDIAKDDKNIASMVTGGIENPKINKAIVDVLEGTRPAFDNRTDKYTVSR